FGDRTFQGSAGGSTPFSSGSEVGIDVPSFTLSGTSPTGSMTATCTGQFLGTTYGVPGAALSILSCDGAVSGGAPAHATLVSAYRATSYDVHFGAITNYEGAFAGA
ncbi:MAG: hypothetical protein JWP02_3792, partial [Acidimicrobiales bacterium]|nr:hypothetical protein [Acidimicrobiales bacterium]